jgi:hypothetical protein
MRGPGMSNQEKIYIDFQGGSHGNYLEFVCNKFLANVKTRFDSPFNIFGSSHQKKYLEDNLFEANHYTNYGIALNKKTVISIQIEYDDLLPLQCISLLRANDCNIDPNEIHINTYNKFNNKNYRWMLDQLLSGFFDEKYFLLGYEKISDPAWPKINSIEDYHNLPIQIQEECENIHGLRVLKLDKNHPNCPKDILKEFFKIGFLQPEQHGFIKRQQINIHQDCRVHRFPFSAFYDKQAFIKELTDLSLFLKMPFDSNEPALHQLHKEFLNKQPYKNAKKECDDLVRIGTIPDNINLIYEAYIAAKLEALKNV